MKTKRVVNFFVFETKKLDEKDKNDGETLIKTLNVSTWSSDVWYIACVFEI